MMISPKWYYHMELARKSPREIQKKIVALKKEIEHLKSIIEQPNHCEEKFIQRFTKPDPSTRLSCTRKYLERAIQAYKETGEEYIPSEEEQKAADFDEAISFISRIVFSIGGYFGGFETRTICLDEDNIYLSVDYTGNIKSSILKPMPEYALSKADFLEELRDIHIGEWEHYYNNPDILDGTQWSLCIEYADSRKPAEYGGSNAYPFSFDEFCELLDIRDDENEEDDLENI